MPGDSSLWAVGSLHTHTSRMQAHSELTRQGSRVWRCGLNPRSRLSNFCVNFYCCFSHTTSRFLAPSKDDDVEPRPAHVPHVLPCVCVGPARGKCVQVLPHVHSRARKLHVNALRSIDSRASTKEAFLFLLGASILSVRDLLFRHEPLTVEEAHTDSCKPTQKAQLRPRPCSRQRSQSS